MEIESRLERVERAVRDEPTHIMDITRSHGNTVRFLKAKGLLKPDPPSCPDCSNPMRTMRNKNKADRQQHRCRSCNIVKTIRYDSIFQDSKLSLIEFTRL